MAAVSVRDVSVAFEAVRVFDSLSLDIEQGEFVVLLGPSGCGKSTLLNAITGLLDRKPDQLSGGQRQRVAIGRALVRDAAVFLFDEPLSNLDAKLRNELRVEIKRLHARLGKTTMIYVTHDQIEAMTLADRIVVMKEQKIQQIGSPDEIYHRPANLFVAGFVGSPQMNFIKGRLENTGEGLSFLAGDRRLSLAGYRFATAPSPGQEVVLGIRPEHFEIASN